MEVDETVFRRRLDRPGPGTAPQPCYEVRPRDGAVEVREPR